MKRMIVISLLLLGSMAFAKDFTGKLVCYPHSMTKPGFLAAVKISGVDSKNVEDSVFGPTVVIDMAEASQAKTTLVTKTLTGDDFKGEIQMDLSFWYRGNIAAGNLEGLAIGLKHKGKNWRGVEETYAKTTVRGSLTESGTIRVELYSGQNNLILTQVECGISQDK